MGSCQYFSSRRLATNTQLVRRSNAHNGACSAPPSWYRSGGVHAGCWRGAAAVVGPGSSCSGRTSSVWRAAAYLTTSRCRREPRQPAGAPGAGAGRRLAAERTGLAFYLPACSCRRAGVHPYPPPSPLLRVADCPPAVSTRGQLAHVAPPPVPPRVPGAFVAL